MRTVVSTILFTSLGAAVAAPAFADEPATTPGFTMMDNTGDGSKIDLDLAAIVPIHPLGDDILLRPSILGQYVAPNGLGGYAGMSMSWEPSSGEASIGNLELGGLYHLALGSNFDLGFRAGLILPTASQNNALLQAVSTAIARPADLATATPDVTWARLGVSPTYHHGPFFLRADLGVDVPIHNGDEIKPIGHVNIGAGIRTGAMSFTAEMQNLIGRGLNDGSDGIGALHTVGLSARYHGKVVSPFVSVSTPLDDGLRGKVLTVTGGLSFAF